MSAQHVVQSIHIGPIVSVAVYNTSTVQWLRVDSQGGHFVFMCVYNGKYLYENSISDWWVWFQVR